MGFTLQRGIVLLNRKAVLDNGLVKAKFFILMEEPTEEKTSLILLMTTTKRTNLVSEIHRRGVIVEVPLQKNKRTLVLTNKYFEVPLEEIKKYERRAILRPSQITLIEEKVKKSPGIPEDIKKRVLFKKEKEEKKATFKLLEDERFREIKQKLGTGE